MPQTAYTYCVIRYVHDPSVGEFLNIGVVLWSSALLDLEFRFEPRTERLSHAFAGFDADRYRLYVERLSHALTSIRDHLRLKPPEISTRGGTNYMKQVLTDENLSFQAGPLLAGITNNIEQEADSIFKRMVASQFPAESQ